MRAGTLAFLMGNLLAMQGLTWSLYVLGFFVLLAKPFSNALWRFALLSLVAYGWTHLAISHEMSKQPKALFESTQTVIGQIVSLPKRTQFATRFDFNVESIPAHPLINPFKARVYWYRSKVPIQAGDRWQLTLRLKTPHGFMNPGGFNFERYLRSQHIQAKAYVKKNNHKIASSTGLLSLRQSLANELDKQLKHSPFQGIIEALAIGNSNHITQSQWQILRATGTNHLVAISGLHIGFVAAFTMMLVGFLWRRSPRAMLFMPAQVMAGISGLLAATGYAALAGFSMSTLRALIMLLVIFVMQLLKRKQNAWQALQSALLVILLLDPFATLSISFWLSFLAVAWILFANVAYLTVKHLWRTQIAVTLGLMPVTLFFFGQVSLLSIPANFIAIPVVAFAVVPMVLVATSVLTVWPALSTLLYQGATLVLQLLWVFLSYIATMRFSVWQYTLPSLFIAISMSVAVALWLSPKAWRLRWLSFIFLFPLLLPTQSPLPEQALRLTALDVGQGTAVLLQTAHHLVLYDTGPKFSSSFNAGDAVILPFLRYHRLSLLDDIVISHGDNDHIGGLRAVMQSMNVQQVKTSVPKKIAGATPCLQGQHWQYDGVDFDFLFPDESHLGLNNNSSCVLLVTAGQYHVLLTGDIEALAERQLLKMQLPKIDVLIAPHHGSKTSSTQSFLERIQPRIVVISLGYHNRFHFPHTLVLARYRALKAEILRTDQLGAISLVLNRTGSIERFFYRQKKGSNPAAFIL